MLISRTHLSDRVRPKAAAHLLQFSREARHHFPDLVTKVLLFGSRARGEATAQSDYDIAVVMKSIPDRRTIDHQLADIAYPHILAGVHIRPVSVLAASMSKTEQNAFVFNLAREGLEVPDASR